MNRKQRKRIKMQKRMETTLLLMGWTREGPTTGWAWVWWRDPLRIDPQYWWSLRLAYNIAITRAKAHIVEKGD